MHPIHAPSTHARARRLCCRLPALLLASLLVGCGGDDPIRPNESIAFLVGDWDAQRFLVESREDPTVKLELIELGAGFSINFQPSGQYTALLVYQGNPLTEIGLVEVDGNEVVFCGHAPLATHQPVPVHALREQAHAHGRHGIPLLAQRVRRRVRDHRAHEAVTFHVEQSGWARILVCTTIIRVKGALDAPTVA